MDDLQANDIPNPVVTEEMGGAGGGAPATLSEPQSARDTLASVFDDADKAAETAAKEVQADDGKGEPKGEEKPADEDKGDKPEPKKPVEKPPAKEAPAQDGEDGDEAKPAKEVPQEKDGTRKHVEPPKEFIPRAKELWRNTPREVQAEVERVMRDTQARVAQHEETVQKYERIRPYAEVVESNGRDLTDSLNKMFTIDRQVGQNPIAALHSLMVEAGPRKADGTPVTLFELAQHIVKNGEQGYIQALRQGAPQQQQQPVNQEAEYWKQQHQQALIQQTAASVIEPFKAQHPRYAELEQDIAFFLESDKVPKSLSPQERLATAYDLAVRVNPASGESDQGSDGPSATDRAGTPSAANKSIKSSLGSVSDSTANPVRSGESTRDTLLRELKRASR